MLKSKFISAVIFGLMFFFTSQAQVDTTDIEFPSDTEFRTPETQTGTEFGTPQMNTQNDTTGRYAAHFRLAEEMAERLGQSLNISEEQKTDVIERIVEFQEEVADINLEMRQEGFNQNNQEDLDEELVSLVDDIENILDDTQRAEWIRMKNDWMTEVKAHIQSERDVRQQDRDIYQK